jgi:HlyD family secretion protein
MNTTTKLACAAAALALLGGCKKQQQGLLYEPIPVERRSITVSAMAAGTIEPILVVDVKSRATGQILEMRVQTGDIVNPGDTLIKVDRRDPTNTLAQAEADMEVARAQLSNAEAQKRRADQMFAAQLLSEQEHDNTNLTFANAQAQLLRAQVGVQTARDALSDCNVLAPSGGTIIQKSTEVGQVITSASRDVSGGTVLLRMADLNVVQVRALVDETDIGKIQPGMSATTTVDAYPNRPFEGTVLKIEPQSTVSQNVTMFAVLIRIPNDQGFLRPGMNADVEIHVGNRTNVLAIPNAALRTSRDVGSAAQVLGLDPKDVDAILARADSQARQNPQTAAGQAGGRGAEPQAQRGTQGQRAEAGRTAAPPAVPAVSPPPAVPPTGAADPARMGGGDRTAMGGMPASPPAGRTGGGQAPGMQGGGFGGAPGPGGFQRPALPAGVTEEQWNAIRQKRQNNEPLTAADSQVLARVRAAREAQGGGMGGGQAGTPGQPGGAPGAGAAAAPGGAPAAGAADGGSGLPAGVSREQLMAIFQKQRSGGTLNPAEQAVMAQMRQRFGGSGGGEAGGGQRRRQFGANSNFQYGGSYIVFVLRGGKPTPVKVRTGFTDMDYSEVISGLTEQDTVLLLPSASLVAQQDEMKSRMARMGGGVPGMSAQPAGGGRGPGGGPGR